MSLQQRLEMIRSAPTPQNEESAKFQIMAPILQHLGWDPYGPEVLYEHGVGGKGGGGRVDIVLTSSSRVVALIEAKAPGADLRSHVGQVLGYAFHEGVDICVLTTGLEWWLYLPRESGPPAERRFAVLKVTEDPVEQLVDDFNAFLSKETLVSGEAERRAEAVLRARLEADRLNKEIPGIWQRILTTPDEDLLELLSKRVYDKLGLRPTREQVSAALAGSPIPSAVVPSEPPKQPPPPTTPERQEEGRKPTRRPVAILLWGERTAISRHLQVVELVANALREKHAADFERILELRGRKHAYVRSSKDGMHAARRVAETDYFVDVHGNADALRKRAEQFLSHFGHSPDDLKILYD